MPNRYNLLRRSAGSLKPPADPPLPHPSWGMALVGHSQDRDRSNRIVNAEDFWRRLEM